MPVIKLRGLPWSCVEDDVVKFLNDVKIQQKVKSEESNTGSDGPCIYLTTNAEGRPSGEAFIELIDEDDVEQALKKNNALMGQRYIEVFRSNTEQLEKHLRESKSNASNWCDPVIRLRGLPYGCTINDIGSFFDGLKIASGGILMVIDFSGRFNGEAFVQFTNMGDAQRALDKHKQKIGNRYIEIFRSTFDEMQYYSANTNSMKNRQQKQSNKMGRFDNGDDNANRNSRGKPYARNNQQYGNRQRGSISPSNDFSFNRNNNMNNEGPFSGGLPSLMSSLFNDNNNSASNSNFFNFNNNGNGNGMGPAVGGGGGVGGGGNFDFNSFMSSSFFTNYANGNNNNFNTNNNDQNYDNYQNDQYNQEEYSLKMRGLPYSATEDDIRQFFEPLNPIQVDFIRTRDKRPSGEAEVFFDDQNDLNKAMKYDKKYMGSRYIELFLVSSGSSNGNSNGNGNGYNNKNGAGNYKNAPVANKTSLSSLMNQDFGGSNNNNNSNNYGPRSSSNGGSNIPPLLPMMPPMPSMVPPPPLAGNNNPSVYSTNINEMLMADMAKKMFASAFGQYQPNNNNQQMFQPKGFSGSFNNNNSGSNNRRY